MLTVLADTFMIATRLEPRNCSGRTRKRWYREAAADEPVRRRARAGLG